MPILAIASRNPVKIQAALNGFRRMFPGVEFEARPIEVASGVSDQPRSDAETLEGASNRARRALELVPEADYGVGIEGGIQELAADPGGMAAFAWVVVRAGNGRTRAGQSRTGTFFLPARVAHLVCEGRELGEADDMVFGRENSRQAAGAVGLLTGDVIDRAYLCEDAVVLALIPFKNPDLYPG